MTPKNEDISPALSEAHSRENYERAVPMFERVLEIDPDYAPAYVELAAAYHDQATLLLLRPRGEGLRMAIDATGRALSVDPDFFRTLVRFSASGWLRPATWREV